VRILGIDPGSARTGFGILEVTGDELRLIDSGLIRINPRQSFPAKLKTVFEGISSLIDSTHPEAMAVEDTFYAKNVRSALALGQVKGVALLAAVLKGCPVFQYSPLDIKKSVVGYGRAEKHQVQVMVQQILGIPEKPQVWDESDALAIAVCHAHSMRFPEWRKG
jgi:crossover junction endodeoxyribonuclease RuvC